MPALATCLHSEVRKQIACSVSSQNRPSEKSGARQTHSRRPAFANRPFTELASQSWVLSEAETLDILVRANANRRHVSMFPFICSPEAILRSSPRVCRRGPMTLPTVCPWATKHSRKGGTQRRLARSEHNKLRRWYWFWIGKVAATRSAKSRACHPRVCFLEGRAVACG